MDSRSEVQRGTASKLRGQRSHVLLVLTDARAGQEAAFRRWYGGPFWEQVSALKDVLRMRLLEQHTVDITGGHWPRPPRKYLCLCDLVLDGAEQAEDSIDAIVRFHKECDAAQAPVTWLYYPAGEPVGRCDVDPAQWTVAFANGRPAEEAAFREWYATRHIRHALILPALIAGQCFERTQYQKPGALPAIYATVALYAQEGTPEDLMQSLSSVPPGSLDFPTLDTERFAECSYQALHPTWRRADAAVGGERR